MYAMTNPQNRYMQQGVMTANPADLIVMLYDGCIKQLKIAALAIEEKNTEKAHSCFRKSEDIMIELVNCLDLNYLIADELLALYEFIIREIIEINASKDASRIEGVTDILGELREAWSEVAKTQKGTTILVEE